MMRVWLTDRLSELAALLNLWLSKALAWLRK